jgi:hypothetical protein
MDEARSRSAVRRVRRSVIVLLAAGSAALGAPGTAFANVPITQVSKDPFTNTSAYHKTQVEPDTFAWGDTIVGVFQTGRFSNGGADDTGWATSTDKGQTWTTGMLPGTTVFATPAGTWARISDPSVAYDPKHDVWLAGGLAIDATVTGKAVLVNRSTDGGLTWKNPVTVSEGTGSDFYDKDWVACDTWAKSPHYGNCYAQWDLASAGDRMRMSTSTDGGKTWKEATVAGGNGLGGQPLAQPNGNVVVPFASDSGPMQAIVSKDGGQTYTGPYTISPVQAHGVTGIRSPDLPSAEVAKDGTIYAAWFDCKFRTGCSTNDIVMSTSTNGKTWSAVARIPIDPLDSTVNHFITGIGVDRATSGATAHLGVTYYFYPEVNCASADCRLYAGFVDSTDGGATWTTQRKIVGPIKLTWLPSAGGRFVGDYVSTSFAGGKAFTVIANATKGTCTLGQITSCHESMVAPSSGLALTAGTIPVGNERPVAEAGHAAVRPPTLI